MPQIQGVLCYSKKKFVDLHHDVSLKTESLLGSKPFSTKVFPKNSSYTLHRQTDKCQLKCNLLGRGYINFPSKTIKRCGVLGWNPTVSYSSDTMSPVGGAMSQLESPACFCTVTVTQQVVLLLPAGCAQTNVPMIKIKQ